MANSICNFSAKVNSHLHTISFAFKLTSIESELDRFLGDEQNSDCGLFQMRFIDQTEVCYNSCVKKK